MPALQLSQVCTVTPTAAQHTHEHVATNPGSWRNLRHRKGSRKQAAPGPRNPPHARSFALLRPPPQANQALPVQQHASVLPASEFHTNGIILHIDWFLVSTGVWLLSLSIFPRVEVGRDSPRFACSCRLFLLLHSRKIYYVNTPWCSYLRVFVHLS